MGPLGWWRWELTQHCLGAVYGGGPYLASWVGPGVTLGPWGTVLLTLTSGEEGMVAAYRPSTGEGMERSWMVIMKDKTTNQFPKW